MDFWLVFEAFEPDNNVAAALVSISLEGAALIRRWLRGGRVVAFR